MASQPGTQPSFPPAALGFPLNWTNVLYVCCFLCLAWNQVGTSDGPAGCSCGQRLVGRARGWPHQALGCHCQVVFLSSLLLLMLRSGQCSTPENHPLCCHCCCLCVATSKARRPSLQQPMRSEYLYLQIRALRKPQTIPGALVESCQELND